MVESSAGGSCRCACQHEDFRGEEEDGEGRECCSPQVFTSVLLGVLACVLMTGGVFLAFHRWDPLWLIVSGIGVVLILIGSVLHCCSSTSDSVHARTRGRHPGGGKSGCCGRPEHHLHGHLVANNGSLTEQLLPLGNARSVSQLSLNMLPGYFPPVVTTYGIEQHSAVVQNINRIIQQQQLQQSPAAGPQSPGAQSGAGGKSFILLSLPGDTTQANIQNLVATVYQLEENSATEAPSAEASVNPATSASSSSAAIPTPTPPVPPLFKSVEVQTCDVWPNAASGCSGLQVNNASQNTASASTSTEAAEPQPSTSAVTQTENDSPIDLMDCAADVPPPRICDSARTQACSDQTTDALTNIPASSSVLVDISESAIRSALVVDVSDTADENLLDLTPATDVLIQVEEGTASCSVDVPRAASSDVLIDISDSVSSSEPSEAAASITPSSDSAASVNLDLVEDTSGDMPASNGASASNHLQVVGIAGSELSLGNLSDMDGEVDDSELIGRSSPPPSYDDATHEGENAIGAFGLAYGTI